MTTLFEMVQQFFIDEGWSTEPVEGTEATLSMGYRGKRGEWTCYARVREAQGQLLFYSQCPLPVPDDQREAMSEFLHRANFGTVIGNFEINLDSGAVRYKASLDLGPAPDLGALPFANLYGRMVGASVGMMDQYLKGIMLVLSNTSVELAIEECEAN